MQVVIRKSHQLTKRQYSKLVRIQKRYPTKVEAAEAIGVTRHTLDRIMLTGRCHPVTAQKIDSL